MDAKEAPTVISLPDGGSVKGIWTVGVEPLTSWTFVYAPGAGSNLSDGFGNFIAQALAEGGMTVLRFEFPYAEAGRRLRDRPPVLEATWRAAIETARSKPGKLAVGGRSMGGRIASQVVAAGDTVDALALFAYPLHPPNRPMQRRDAHMARLRLPVYLCSGTRDAFATVEELHALRGEMPHATLQLLAEADHGFQVRKRSGRTREGVWREAAEGFANWVASINRP